jgi:hypothetical protein
VIERCVILAAGEVLRVDPTMLMYEPPSAVSAPAMGDGNQIASLK